MVGFLLKGECRNTSQVREGWGAENTSLVVTDPEPLGYALHTDQAALSWCQQQPVCEI